MLTQPFDIDSATEETVDERLTVDGFLGVLAVDIENHQPPHCVRRVAGAQDGPKPAPIDGDERGAELLAAFLQKVGRPEKKIERMVQHSMPAELDSNTASHHAVGAVASDQILGLDPLAPAALKIDDVRGHPLVGSVKRFEPPSVSQIDVGKRAGAALQDRVEPHLRADLLPHGLYDSGALIRSGTRMRLSS